MSTTLDEFIAKRLAELDAEEAHLVERISSILEERQTLLKAKAAASNNAQSDTGRKNEKRNPIGRIKPGTIMDAVLRILANYPKGLIALDILAKLNMIRDSPIERTSLSPQLSRLKQGGFIELEGSAWKLTRFTQLQMDNHSANT